MSLSKLDLWLRGFSPTARYEGEGDMKPEYIRKMMQRPVTVHLTAKGAILDADEQSMIFELAAELKSMETPITPEVLDAAMFQKGSDGVWYYAIDYSNGQFVEVTFEYGLAVVSVVFHDSAIRAKGVKTMHDLGVLYGALRGDE